MKPVGVVVRSGSPQALQLAGELRDWIHAQGGELISGSEAKVVPGVRAMPLALLCRTTDPIVTLGGDGTLLGAARFLGDESPRFVGVHFGNLGFLTEVLPHELFEVLERVFAGSVTYRERRLVGVHVLRHGQRVLAAQGVNDVVILKEASSRLVDLDLAVNEEMVMHLRTDGVIFSTPTGSTAYSLAAGGSIVAPGVSVLLVTPLCPHSLTVRPFILPDSATIEATIGAYDGRLSVTVDGQVAFPLEAGDVVRVHRAPSVLRTVVSPYRSYFELLRTKLNWGLGLQEG